MPRLTLFIVSIGLIGNGHGAAGVFCLLVALFG